MLTHRERVQMTLNHEKTDRVPVDLGGTQTSILKAPYDELKRVLGIHTPTTVSNIILGLAKIDDEILERFDIDLRHILPGTPDTWKFRLLPDDSFDDEWGVRWHRPKDGYYYDMISYPLDKTSLTAVEAYQWPDPFDPGRVRGVADQVSRLAKSSEFAIEAGLVGLWESAWFLVGFEHWLQAVMDSPEFVEAVLDGVLNVLKPMHTAYLDVAGPYLDLVTLWDDYGTQYGPLISPKLWRRLVKPRLADLIASIKLKTTAQIGLHCCGSLVAILDDLVEVGIEVLNPVQVSARGMNPPELKKRYGQCLTFWGGIDTQSLLPEGKPEQVQDAVKQTIDTLGRGGGLILAAVHNIQPGVPPENIIAMYDTAMNYPLK